MTLIPHGLINTFGKGFIWYFYSIQLLALLIVSQKEETKKANNEGRIINSFKCIFQGLKLMSNLGENMVWPYEVRTQLCLDFDFYGHQRWFLGTDELIEWIHTGCTKTHVGLAKVRESINLAYCATLTGSLPMTYVTSKLWGYNILEVKCLYCFKYEHCREQKKMRLYDK